MNIALIVDTLVNLKPTQLFYQVVSKVSTPSFRKMEAPILGKPPIITPPIPKNRCLVKDVFSFLNIEDHYISWNNSNHGMLWAYNLNYMDWLQQEKVNDADCGKWIDKFIKDIPENRIGLDPYPIALRSINWIKVFTLKPALRTQDRDDYLYSQVKLLEKKLEYRLLGNHLLEDAYALFIASLYFKDIRLWKKSIKLLKSQLDEQVLQDGAHYEQSPMYHCILLDRLMDCYNFSLNNYFFDNQSDITAFLGHKASLMLGHLNSVKWADNTIPLLNDAAYGIAPTPKQLFDYAQRLRISWKRIALKECGYRKLKNQHLEAIVDVGNITATYQPGHTHADTFSYELRIDGKPFVVDTGISTYDKTLRRQYERSTMAHNTVVVDNKDSSRVWGGFRVGKRCRVTIEEDTEKKIVANHDGYAKPCRRSFRITDELLMIKDYYEGNAVSYIHLVDEADLNRISIEGATHIEIDEDRYSVEYNRFVKCKVMKIFFNGELKYTIR